MATHRLLFPQAQQEGPATQALLARVAQRSLLCRQDWLSMAQCAKGLCSLGHHLPLFPALEAHRFVGGDSHPFAGAGACGRRTQAPAQCGHHRQPKCQELRKQRPTGLRRGQKDQWTQARYLGRHPWLAAPGQSIARQYPRSRWRQAIVGGLLPSEDSPQSQTHLGRRWLCRRVAGVGKQTVALHRRNREALRPAYLQGAATALGSGANVRLVRAFPPTHSGLRTPSPDRRNHRLFGDDSPHVGSSRKTLNAFSNRRSDQAGRLVYLRAMTRTVGNATLISITVSTSRWITIRWRFWSGTASG